MNDVTILDLFWLILKLLAALGLVGLIGFVFYLAWVGTKRAGKTAWDIVRGRNASVTATVCFVIAVVVLVTCIALAAGYLHDHPNLF
ncbi:MAG: hypothetical protein WCA76_17580 [Candidatus Sulfotelmatobacter sp.]|jgi:uncharacterized membrane protein